jgi:hypothetical protein
MNSALVCGISAAWLGPRAGLAAGLVFALFPASAEAVAWTAGIFDLLATTFVLLAVTIWLRVPPTGHRITALVGLCLAGLLSKESAIVLPVLLVLIVFASARTWRETTTQGLSIALMICTVLGFVITRMLLSSAVADHLEQIPAGRRQWKDLLVRPFTGLALPMRTDTGISSEAYLSGLIVLALIGIVLWQIARSRSNDMDQRATVLTIGVGWIVLAALPLLVQFYVSPTLQGSRYLYLPSAGFALVLSTDVAGNRLASWEAVASVMLLSLLGVYGVRLKSERDVWMEAAGIRDALLAQAFEVVRTTPCRTLTVLDPPDSIRGAFVFREGLEDALDSLPKNPAGVPCTFRWSGSALVTTGGS